jgi:hypothetical protein
MRKGWMVAAVCAGVAAGSAWGASQPTQAAMVIGDGMANMSLVEPAAKRKRSKAQCTDYIFVTCCKEPGKPEYCKPKLM